MPFRGNLFDWKPIGNNMHIDLLGAYYTLDQSQTTDHTVAGIIGNNNAGIIRSFAQSFVAGESGYCKKISLELGKINTPNDLSIKIYTDNGGKPGSHLVVGATGFVIDVDDVTVDTGAGEHAVEDVVDANASYFLTAGVTYWLVMTQGAAANNYYKIYGGGTAPSGSYADGFCMINNTIDATGTWIDNSATIADLYFRTYVGKGAAEAHRVDFHIYNTNRYL